MGLTQYVCGVCRGWQNLWHDLTPTFDWSDILNDPGGLLLVCSDHLPSPFHVYYENSK